MTARRLAAGLLATALSGPWLPVTPTPPVDDVATAPCSAASAVHVRPGDDVVRTVSDASPGATVCFAPGTYRLTRPIRPHAGQVLVGHDAVLTGSRPLRGFTRTADDWVIGGQRQQGQRHGECLPLPSILCTFPDDVLRDDRPLRRVLHRADLAPGTFWFDYRRDRVHVHDNPHGHRLEAAVAPAAVLSRAGARGADVTVRGFTVEEFATIAQHGAIETSAPGWTIENNAVRRNHGAGITTQGDVRVLDNRVLRNGQLGIGGTGPSTLVAGNEIAHNNTGGFDPGWEAGGAKWAVTDGLVVRANRVHDNRGPGLWTDIDAQDTRYVRNVVRDNDRAGIFHEISADALIAHNTVTGNGHGFAVWLWGSGVLVAGSYDVEVAHNRLAGNAMGIGLVQQDRGVSDVDGTPRRLHEVAVHDNTVALARGETGMVQDDGHPELFDDPTISWTGNVWTQRSPSPFMWDDDYLTLRQWRALGHDAER